MTLASVLVPIHDKPTTLPLTVDTVLRQSVEDLEVLLVGDGVTDAVRTVAQRLCADDERVRFLDLPKGAHHGERHRHHAIEVARGEAILYVCDDDLLLPDHVADLLALLTDHDLAQSLNGWVTADGSIRLYAADLSDPDTVSLHRRDDLRHNSVSITGTAHTRSAYARVEPWDTTPQGWWPDHWQFRRMLGPGFRAATSSRVTALQFPTSADGRDTWDDAARADEVVPWHALVTSPGGQDEVDRLVREGMLAQLRDVRRREPLDRLASETAQAELQRLRDRVADLEGEVVDLRRHAAGLGREVEVVSGHVGRLVEIRTAHEEKIASLRARLRRKDERLARLRRALEEQR